MITRRDKHTNAVISGPLPVELPTINHQKTFLWPRKIRYQIGDFLQQFFDLTRLFPVSSAFKNLVKRQKKRATVKMKKAANTISSQI